MGLYYALFLIPLILPFYFWDKTRQERVIERSKVDWVIVRPAALTNGTKRGRLRHGSRVGSLAWTEALAHICETLMHKDPADRLPGALRWLCWLPLICLLGIELYVRKFDGWGAWASAPLLLVPAIVSLPIVFLALLKCSAAMRARAPLFATVFFTLVSAVPIVWLGVRRFFM